MIHNVTLIPGDGIGQEVTPEGVRVCLTCAAESGRPAPGRRPLGRAGGQACPGGPVAAGLATCATERFPRGLHRDAVVPARISG